MFYLVKAPWLLKKLYPNSIWHINTHEKIIYLTFDDGPHPEATPFVLQQLKSFNAKATFFCIGKNVVQYPDDYRKILDDGHKVGNHTFDHLNGWKVSDEEYLQDVIKAAKFIDSNFFRPPYGRSTKFQNSVLENPGPKKQHQKFKIVMWDVLSGDFDTKIPDEACALNVIRNSKKGSIVVFHDSEKAFPRLRGALPKVLQFFYEKGFRFESIPG